MDTSRNWLAPAAFGAAVVALVISAYAAGRGSASAPPPASTECECSDPPQLAAAVRRLESQLSDLSVAVQRGRLADPDGGAAAATDPRAPVTAGRPMVLASDVARDVGASVARRGSQLRACMQPGDAVPETPVQVVFQFDAAGQIVEASFEPNALSEEAQRCMLEVLTSEPHFPEGTDLQVPVMTTQPLPLGAP